MLVGGREGDTQEHCSQCRERADGPPTGRDGRLKSVKQVVAMNRQRRALVSGAWAQDNSCKRREVATSMTPATIPAVVRTSRKPKRLIRNDNR